MSISGNQTALGKAQNDVLDKILNGPATSSPPRPFRAPDAGNDGSGTDALCRSLAGRVVTALCGGSNVVLLLAQPSRSFAGIEPRSRLVVLTHRHLLPARIEPRGAAKCRAATARDV